MSVLAAQAAAKEGEDVVQVRVVWGAGRQSVQHPAQRSLSADAARANVSSARRHAPICTGMKCSQGTTQSVKGSAKMVALTTAAWLSINRRKRPLQESAQPACRRAASKTDGHAAHCRRHPARICRGWRDLQGRTSSDEAAPHDLILGVPARTHREPALVAGKDARHFVAGAVVARALHRRSDHADVHGHRVEEVVGHLGRVDETIGAGEADVARAGLLMAQQMQARAVARAPGRVDVPVRPAGLATPDQPIKGPLVPCRIAQRLELELLGDDAVDVCVRVGSTSSAQAICGLRDGRRRPL